MPNTISATPVRGPRRFTERELSRGGIRLLDAPGFWLSCLACGNCWSPDIPSGRSQGARMHKGWWICPHGGCNKRE